MAVNDGLAFWNALKSKIKSLIKQETTNCFRMERYDVTTAPNGTTIGVTLPEGSKEIKIPYSNEVSAATVGDTVIVGWRGSLSNAKAIWMGNGYSGGGESGSNYCKMADGTLICWGGGELDLSVSAGSTGYKSVEFAKSFYDTSYTAVCNSLDTVMPARKAVGVGSKTKTGFTIRCDNQYTAAWDVYVQWMAIGRWRA